MLIVNDERGATAITVAMWMFFLMGIAALAIDLGFGFNERRSDQNAVDTAVLAGAVEIGLGGTAQDSVDEIVAYVDTNLRPVSIAEWESCTDPDAYAVTADSLGLTPATECISFNSFEIVRGRVPDQQVDTVFGRILGFGTITTHASAEALVHQFPSDGAGPPFVALNGVQGGDQICLRTSSSGPDIPPLWTGNGPGTPASEGIEPDPCDENVYDPDSQFFGTLDPYAYFDPADGSVTCTSNLVDYAIAAGIDHPITDFEPDFVVGVSNPVGIDVREEECNPDPILNVNTMKLKTGLTASILRCGMLTTNGGTCGSSVPAPGSNSVPARLHTGDYVQDVYTFLGEDMDNKPVWDLMVNTNTATVPVSCDDLYDHRSDATWDYFDKKDRLIDCLIDWRSTVPPLPATNWDPLFTWDIIHTSRFGWIPYLAESNLTTEPSTCPSSAATNCVHFNDFAPIYIQTLYTMISGNSNNSGACDPGGSGQRWGRHDAGQAQDCGKSNQNLDRLSAIVLDCGMLPADLCEARPGLTPGGDVDPTIELVK